MKQIFKAISILVVLSLTACSGSSGSDSGNNGNVTQKNNFVNWGSVSPEYNPSTEDHPFRTFDVDRIKLNLFDAHDVEVIYSSEFRAGEANLRIFKVWKNQARWGNITNETKGRNLEIHSYGQYQCSIQVTNGNITSLDGGCYVKAQIFLPRDAEIEVYYQNQLLTNRFIPMDNASFFEELRQQYNDEKRFVVIDNFISSYTGSRSLVLSCDEMGLVVRQFAFGEAKLEALRRLQPYIRDRENLAAMIKERFSYFDQEKVRRIVGLP